ncbi:hypothetical protein [Pseudomonas sp. 460]|uniref:hypothetical protein n=1 Tax=Pseudomonas sp. 460 TaxID=2485142 RepID=UPI00104C54F6|nr:hypothetical protein [Pseudomonas sp. 460]TCV51439.1 hypothetical protein EDB99_107105 [Pseudomonas sp. 460]
MSSKRTMDGVPLALLETIDLTWRQADEFSPKANEMIAEGLMKLREILATPSVLCHGCLVETCDPKHFVEAGKCVLELVPALIAENEELKAKTATWCGYGDESLMHTFYGDAASIRALGEIIFELEGLRQDAKRPWWLRVLSFSSRTTTGSPAALTNTSGHAHCPHCAVCHTAEETCVQALRRVLALYESPKHGSGGVAPCV